jgi:hypothetical protein
MKALFAAVNGPYLLVPWRSDPFTVLYYLLQYLVRDHIGRYIIFSKYNQSARFIPASRLVSEFSFKQVVVETAGW